MRVKLVLVHLAEDRGLVVDRLGLPAEQSGGKDGDVSVKGDFGAGHYAHRKAAIVRSCESASSGAEVPGHELIANFRRPRSNGL